MTKSDDIPDNHLVKVEHIPVPEGMIMVEVDGRKMFFTEKSYVETWDKLARLWEDLYYGKHRG